MVKFERGSQKVGFFEADIPCGSMYMMAEGRTGLEDLGGSLLQGALLHFTSDALQDEELQHRQKQGRTSIRTIRGWQAS
jgi:hypothetical protein